jgi:hypothetical protein
MVKGNIGEIKKGKESNSKKLDTILTLLTNK